MNTNSEDLAELAELAEIKLVENVNMGVLVTDNDGKDYPYLNDFRFCIDVKNRKAYLTAESRFLVKVLEGTQFGPHKKCKYINKEVTVNEENISTTTSLIDTTIKLKDIKLKDIKSTETTFSLYMNQPIFTIKNEENSHFVVLYKNEPPNIFYLINCTDGINEIQNEITEAVAHEQKVAEGEQSGGGTRKRRASKKKRKAKTPKRRRKHAKKS